MGCSSSPYVNFSHLLADGCCNVVGGKLQDLSRRYYDYMAPFIINQLTKVKAGDSFGTTNYEEKALNTIMDIHMLYGYLLSVEFQREWDQELDEPCHHDFGNKYYWDKYKFACIADHFTCYGMNILPALDIFEINKNPLLTDGIGFMRIFKEATPDTAEFAKSCSGSSLVGLAQSISLEDILIDNVSISPSPHTELTMALMLDYVKNLLEGLYDVTFTIIDNGADNFEIRIEAPFGVPHPTTIEIITQYHYLPPPVPSPSFYGADSFTGDPCFIQFNFPGSTPTSGLLNIYAGDTSWASFSDWQLAAGPTVFTDICDIANAYLNYINTLTGGVYSIVFCSGLIMKFQTSACVDIFIKAGIRAMIQPPEETEDCTFLSSNITGGHPQNFPIDPCTSNNSIFHVS